MHVIVVRRGNDLAVVDQLTQERNDQIEALLSLFAAAVEVEDKSTVISSPARVFLIYRVRPIV